MRIPAPLAGFSAAILLAALAAPSALAGSADGTWSGLVEINPASDMVDESGPECRDGRVRLVLEIDGGAVSGRLEPLGNPGAPGFAAGPIALSGSLDAASGRLELRSGPTDFHYNRLFGSLSAGTWRNAACQGDYRLQKSG